MSVRLCNAPGTFRYFGSDVLRDLLQSCVVPYLDSIRLFPGVLRGVHRPDVSSHTQQHQLCQTGEGPGYLRDRTSFCTGPEKAEGGTHKGCRGPWDSAGQAPRHGWGSGMGQWGQLSLISALGGPYSSSPPSRAVLIPRTSGNTRLLLVGSLPAVVRGVKWYGCHEGWRGAPLSPSCPQQAAILSSSHPFASSRHNHHQCWLSIFIEKPRCWRKS